MKKVLLFILGIIVVSSLIMAQDFIGVKKCKMCHKGEKKSKVYEKWEAGPHAGAFKTLKDKGEDKNPKCLECHVTGFNAGGYKIGDANASKFEGVQCESCHGPGSKYKKISIMKDLQKCKDNGLLIPDEKMCKKCHNKKSPTYKPFNYKEASKMVNHLLDKKK